MTTLMQNASASASADVALNRFGLGARPDEATPNDVPRWLLQQFDRFDPRPAALASVPTRAAVGQELAEYLDQNRAARQQRARQPLSGPGEAASGGQRRRNALQESLPRMPMGELPAAMATGSTPMVVAASPRDMMAAPQPGGGGSFAAGTGPAKNPVEATRQYLRRQSRDVYVTAVGARADAALVTPAPFIERLVHFWSNHFAVSADKLTVVGLSGLLEFDAVRPHVLGRFGDMLGAVERHPAMLLYLDQAASVGPDSMVGTRFGAGGAAPRPGVIRKLGLNENLAREILELHTLGVRTGYDQADVTEFARALTGWTVAGLGRGPGARFAGTTGRPGDFVFSAALHEPGARTIMGRRYDQAGERQAQAVLDDLAVHPATAQHIATKLARHFAGDTPPPALVARLTETFLTSHGDLPSVYGVLIAAPEVWNAPRAKFRSPWEWSIASYRALGFRTVQPLAVTGLLNQLGQPIWRPGSPAGYDDLSASWAGPDAVMRRVEAAERFATRSTSAIDPSALAARLFPASVSASTADALRRAESPGQGLALLLVSPEFMRR